MQVKVASPEEYGRILTRETVPFPREITKEGAQSLRMKMPNAALYLKEATVIYGVYLLAARLSELTSRLERLDYSHLFNSKYWSKLSTDWSSGERWHGIVKVQFVEMTGAVATKQASVTIQRVSVVWAFLQK